MKTICQKQMIDQQRNLPNGYEYANSINHNNCVASDTQIIIVDTITPPAGNDYFYTAPRNRIYGYIDAARGTNLKGLKTQLVGSNTPTGIINQIKNTLINEHIAFLDIFESVIRKSNRPYDSDIKYATLDYNTFKKTLNKLRAKPIKVICNSRLAERGFKSILKGMKSTCNINFTYLSQRCGKKTDWINALK